MRLGAPQATSSEPGARAAALVLEHFGRGVLSFLALLRWWKQRFSELLVAKKLVNSGLRIINVNVGDKNGWSMII